MARFDPRLLFRTDAQADRIVPPTGFTARLVVFAAAAMAFLGVLALAFSLAAGRLAERWDDELAQAATIRIVAPPETRAALTERTLRILETTAGVAFARALDMEEQRSLLAPWLGEGIDLERLPVPQLIEVIREDTGFDATGLRLRLEAEVPGAVLDDHAQWRAPMVAAADRLRLVGWLCVLLLLLSIGAMVSLAANASLAANGQIIRVLRLVGATDDYIARAFIRRFTLRAFWGAGLGMLIGLAAVAALPTASDQAGVLSGLGFEGVGWLWPFAIPPLTAAVAFGATEWAAKRVLGELT